MQYLIINISFFALSAWMNYAYNQYIDEVAGTAMCTFTISYQDQESLSNLKWFLRTKYNWGNFCLWSNFKNAVLPYNNTNMLSITWN